MSVVQVAGIEPANSLVISKPCTVWCPYRCPSAPKNGWIRVKLNEVCLIWEQADCRRISWYYYIKLRIMRFR